MIRYDERGHMWHIDPDMKVFRKSCDWWGWRHPGTVFEESLPEARPENITCGRCRRTNAFKSWSVE